MSFANKVLKCTKQKGEAAHALAWKVWLLNVGCLSIKSTQQSSTLIDIKRQRRIKSLLCQCQFSLNVIPSCTVQCYNAATLFRKNAQVAKTATEIPNVSLVKWDSN